MLIKRIYFFPPFLTCILSTQICKNKNKLRSEKIVDMSMQRIQLRMPNTCIKMTIYFNTYCAKCVA